MVSIDPASLGLQMGGSAILGAVIGFAAKKVAKIIAIIVGLELVLFKFLESQGFLHVNWSKFVDSTEESAQQAPGQVQGLVETFISTAGVGAGFAAGFLLGFKRA